MNSRLFRITDWSALAHVARYNCEILASMSCTSDRQLERFFVAEFKQPPKQWMQAVRMQIARDLIQRGFSTKAVADELFYEGSCQFCREFKRYFEHTPQFYAPGPNVGFRSIKSDSAHQSGLNVLGNTFKLSDIRQLHGCNCRLLTTKRRISMKTESNQTVVFKTNNCLALLVPILLCAAACFFSALTAQAQPAIANGTFNSGIGSWTTAGGSWNGDEQAMILNGNGDADPANDPKAEQTISGFTVGNKYLITGGFKGVYTANGSASAYSFGVEISGMSVKEYQRPQPNGTTATFTYSFTATSTSHLLRITAERNGDDSSYQIDNVAIEKVPLLATVTSDGWTAYPFLNGGGSQYYVSTTSSINTTGLQNPAPQAVYRSMQVEGSTLTWTANNLSPTATYKVRVHLSSIPFTEYWAVDETLTVTDANNTYSITGVVPYTSGGYYQAMIREFSQNFTPNASGQISGSMIPTGAGKLTAVCGVEIVKNL